MRLVDTSAWIEWLIGSPTGVGIAPLIPDRSAWLVPTMVQLELAKWLIREKGDDLARATLVQPIWVRRRPALRDPGDDLVLECALEAHAEAIITMNGRDFAGAAENVGLRILKPGDLVAELRKEDEP